MKIQDYDLVGMPSSLQDVIEEIRIVLNEGRYQLPVSTADKSGTDAQDGELWLVVQGASARLEAFYNGTWYYWEKTGTV